MKETTTISQLSAGMSVKQGESQFMVDAVVKTEQGYKLSLSDSTGKIEAIAMDGQFSDEKMEIAGKVITLDGVVLYKGDDMDYIRIREFKEVPKEEQSLTVFQNISDERLDAYEKELAKLFVHLKGSPYEELCRLCFSRARLDMMRRLPATLSRHGSVGGGMLQAIVLVTRLAVETGRYYINLANGLYESRIEWDLLIAGALLHNIGNFLYYSSELPHSKTTLGINYGYQGCVTEELENVIRTNGLEISPVHKAKLIGVIAQCNTYKAGAKALRVEAVLLRQVFATFTMADMFDKQRTLAEQNGTGGDREYVYDTQLRCYVTLDEREEG